MDNNNELLKIGSEIKYWEEHVRVNQERRDKATSEINKAENELRHHRERRQRIEKDAANDAKFGKKAQG